MAEERWLSVEEIAQYLGVSKETVYRWLDRGAIPSNRIGKLWRFKPSEVDAWVKSGAARDRSAKRNLRNSTKQQNEKDNI